MMVDDRNPLLAELLEGRFAHNSIHQGSNLGDGQNCNEDDKWPFEQPPNPRQYFHQIIQDPFGRASLADAS